MQLQRGTRLGPYAIVELLGAGGMGEVYLARDTRLSRNVAIKILPADLEGDARLRLRLEREAKAIAALNHPHICTLHDLRNENGVEYLVMEFCEGRSLADRLARGPMPVDQVLELGAQIADALGRAHRTGIIHRDLKPSNVMLTPTGAKVLDFGLAKHTRLGGPAEEITASLGVSGSQAFAGTLGYLAPEVLAGGEADRRSDIFALGAVLYEMLTGMPAFPGRSKAEIIAAILEREPRPLSELAPSIPNSLAHAVHRCLSKDPDARWESARDLAEQLRWMRQRGDAPAARRARRVLPWLAGLLVLIAAIVVWKWPREVERAAPMRLAIPVSEADRDGEEARILIAHLASNVAISADGAQIAYTAARKGKLRLFVRPLNAFGSIEVGGTEGAVGPFFSPDGTWIGFMTSVGMKRVRPGGGAPETITRELRGNARGAVWAPDGTIYFAPDASSPIWGVPASGGKPAPVTDLDAVPGETSHRWPALLPGGKHLLFTIRGDDIRSFNQAKIAVLDLETGARRVVLEGGSRARWIRPGNLLFSREGALYVVGFDLDSLTVRGNPRKVLDGIASGPAGNTSDYDVSESGTLVYVAGPVPDDATDILSVTRSGEARTVGVLPFSAIRPALSPDGRVLAVNGVFANDDIYLYDMQSGATNRFSFERGDETTAVWTPDGQHIVYNSFRPPRLMMRTTDGSAEAEVLLHGVVPAPLGCSPDGNTLYFVDRDSATGWDIWMMPLRGADRKPRALLRTRFNEVGGMLSPDGKWLAFVSNESGAFQVGLRPSQPGGPQWTVSTEGGGDPQWSPDGKEIFFRSGDDLLSARVIHEGGAVRTAKPEVLFSTTATQVFVPVGEEFLMLRPRGWDQPRPTQINVVPGWAGAIGRQ